MADLPVIPQRKPKPDVYTSLLVASIALLLAGSVWMALKNTDLTTVESRQGGPFEFIPPPNK